jgi:hypothetical protein
VENFDIFVTGIAATVAAVVVFVGSVWLLLTMVLGARLAYFVTASLTLGFVLIMAVVWSIGTPLGPVGKLPEFDPVAIATTPSELDFQDGAAYPDAPWRPVDPDNEADTAKAGELSNAAADYLAEAIDRGEITNFTDARLASADTESVRFLERKGTTYGAITFGPGEATDPITGEVLADQPNEGQVVVVMSFDPGNPNSTARQIAGGTLLLLVLHLWGLSRMERRARRPATP